MKDILYEKWRFIINNKWNKSMKIIDKNMSQIIMHAHTLRQVSLLCCSVVMLDIKYEILLVRSFHWEIVLFFICDIIIKLSEVWKGN